MEREVLLGNRIKSLCEERGWSYVKLAEESGVPVKRVYRLINGMVSNPGVFQLMDICKALGITLDELFDAEEFWKGNAFEKVSK